MAAKKKRVRKPPGPTKTRWEKSAERENARRWKKAPLFVYGGLVPLATPAERQEHIELIWKDGDRRREAQEQQDAARGQELREKVRARVTPEKFAELEVRYTTSKFPSEAIFFSHVNDELDRAEGLRLPVALPKRARREQPQQGTLFAELPSGAEVPAVAEGHTLSLAAIAAEHGIELATAGPELPPSPGCSDCGWVGPAPGEVSSVINVNVHPRSCPAMRAFILGLRENCPDCRKRRYSSAPASTPCEVHHARTLACEAEGCIPGPPTSPHDDDPSCQRCRISMEAPPYKRAA